MFASRIAMGIAVESHRTDICIDGGRRITRRSVEHPLPLSSMAEPADWMRSLDDALPIAPAGRRVTAMVSMPAISHECRLLDLDEAQAEDSLANNDDAWRRVTTARHTNIDGDEVIQGWIQEIGMRSSIVNPLLQLLHSRGIDTLSIALPGAAVLEHASSLTRHSACGVIGIEADSTSIVVNTTASKHDAGQVPATGRLHRVCPNRTPEAAGTGDAAVAISMNESQRWALIENAARHWNESVGFARFRGWNVVDALPVCVYGPVVRDMDDRTLAQMATLLGRGIARVGREHLAVADALRHEAIARRRSWWRSAA